MTALIGVLAVCAMIHATQVVAKAKYLTERARANQISVFVGLAAVMGYVAGAVLR